MKIKLLKSYGLGDKGEVLTDVPLPVAELLIKRKIARKLGRPKKCSSTK
jgi:hypothetical protein